MCSHNTNREPRGLNVFQVELASNYFGELPNTMIKIENSPQAVWRRFVEGNVKGDCFKAKLSETLCETTL